MRRGRVIAALLLAGGCSDALEQDTTAGQIVAFVNRDELTLSLVDATRFDVAWVGLASVGTPSSIAARDSVLIVPLGSADSVRILDYTGPSRTGRTVPLPAGSGATGAAVQDETTAWVANPNRNSVTRVNYRTGDTASFPVGPVPRAAVYAAGSVFVVNSNVAGGTPTGPSSVSWIAGSGGPLVTTGSFPLSCTNAQFVTRADDGLLYVTCAGTPGAGDGRLSIVDPTGRREEAVINGLGESPGPAASHPSGRLLVASPTHGVLEVSTLTRTITRGPGAGVKPSGDGIAAIAVDQRGRVWAAAPKGCTGTAGVVHVLSAPPDYREIQAVTVGSCPVAAAVAVLPGAVP